jgi:general secretion pathway protein F
MDAPQLHFDLVTRSSQGHIGTLRLQAMHADAARALAALQGYQVLECTPNAGNADSAPRTGRARGQRSARLDVANLAYELATLMDAGLSMLDALGTLSAKETNNTHRLMLDALRQSIREGLPLSAAMQRTPDRFAPLLVATVTASEQTGDLSAALLRYAAHQQTIKALRDKVVGAAIYPLLLLGVGCVVILFLITVVVPKFAVLIESTRHALPWSSRLLMTWGRFAAAHALPLAISVAALLSGAAYAVRRTWRNGARAGWLDKVPMIGPAVRKFRHAQLYRTTGMLVGGGISIPRALQLSASLLGESDQARLERAVQLLHEGRSLSDALQISSLADPVATSMLAVAQRTGTLSDIMERIAQFHESRLQRSVELTSRLFEPLLMILIGLVVGAIVVLMYLPIFDLASSLQ